MFVGVLTGGLASASAPALAAAPEAPVSKPATAITATTATLNGELNPGASTTAGYHFTYNTNGTCTAGATTTPGAEATGRALEASTPVTGLEGSTEYTFCVVATHTEAGVTESISGLPLTFTTLATKPVVDGEGSSEVTPFSATLDARVNPENQAVTSCVFEYGKTVGYGTSVACQQSYVEGSSDQPVSAGITGLQAATPYHYRLVVENATGEAKGVDGELTTPALERPTVSRESASGLALNGAILEAQVNPNYQETSYSFEYAEKATGNALEGPVTTVAGSGSLAGVGDQVASVETDGQQPDTTYYYRVVATNKAGQTDGPVQAFTTLAASPQTPPVAVTGEVLDVTQLSATLTGTVDTRASRSTLQFELGTTTESGALELASAIPGSESGSTVGISTSFGNYLQSGTTYYYRAVATNEYGTGYGVWKSFTTGSFPPLPTLVSIPVIVISPSATQGAQGKRETLTNAQRLAKALKACTKKPRKQRAACQKQARKRYARVKK
jgi:hypothetical protein